MFVPFHFTEAVTAWSRYPVDRQASFRACGSISKAIASRRRRIARRR
jgi:hypothetical protein